MKNLMLLSISLACGAKDLSYSACVPNSPGENGCPIRSVSIPKFNSPGALSNIFVIFGHSSQKEIVIYNNNDYRVKSDESLSFNTKLNSPLGIEEEFKQTLGQNTVYIEPFGAVTNNFTLILAPSSPVTLEINKNLEIWQGPGYATFEVTPTSTISLETQGDMAFSTKVHNYSYLMVIYQYASVPESGVYPLECWARYPDRWPVSGVEFFGYFYSKSQLVKILNSPDVNYSTVLFKELVAARLNTFPSLGNANCVNDATLKAEQFLINYPVNVNNAPRSPLIDVLNKYNGGKSCCKLGAGK